MESVEEALTGHLELAEQLRVQLLTLQTSLERPPPPAQSTVRPSVLAGALVVCTVCGENFSCFSSSPCGHCLPARPPA